MAENEVRVIRELPRSMINKIAAGEVVERPGSVVKELVENSIDAGATRVDLEVDKSGVERIRVIDNGCGIPADQLQLALSPHATSKISQPDDLFHISTLGFRGEALASIAEISHLTLTTRIADSPSGARIRCDGGEMTPVEECGRSFGTTIDVCDLFFNVPVRRKFLKSDIAEYSQIKEALVRIAIPNYKVAFSLKHNGAVDLNLPPDSNMLERISRVFGGRRIAEQLVPVERSFAESGVKVTGYLGRPELTRGTSVMQYLFVNGRFFRDKTLFAALKSAYQGVLKQGMFPVVFLNIETPLDFVDVNVHPTKQEVHFVNGQEMYSDVLHSVRDRLHSTNLERRPDVEVIAASAGVTLPSVKDDSASSDGKRDSSAREGERPRELRFVPDLPDPNSPQSALDPGVAARARAGLDEWFREAKAQSAARKEEPAEAAEDARRENASRDAAEYPPLRASRDPRTAQTTRLVMGQTSEFRKFPNLNEKVASRSSRESTAPTTDSDSGSPFPPGSFGGRVPTVAAASKEERTLVPEEEPLRALSFDERRARILENTQRGFDRDRIMARTSDGRPVVQFCNRYLVMEAPDGIALVDQHALHERILYEKIRASYEKDDVQVQKLLVPEPVDLSATEHAFAVENRELFRRLGVEFEPFGGSTVIINGCPALLQNVSPSDVFQAALGALLSKRAQKTTLADMIDGALCQMACKAAIKAGDKLTQEGVAELVAQAEMEVFAHHCPHGRPSTVVFTTDKLDQFFIRD